MTLEKFVVMMYNRSSTSWGVEDARLDVFARKQTIWRYSSMSNSYTSSAYEMHYLPGKSYMEPINNLPNTKQSVLPIGDRSWLDHDRWSVADILNHSSTDWRDFQHQIMCGCKTNVNDTNAIALVWLALFYVSADVKARCSWAPFKLYDRDSILIYEKQFEPFDNHGNLWSHYVSVTMLGTFT